MTRPCWLPSMILADGNVQKVQGPVMDARVGGLAEVGKARVITDPTVPFHPMNLT